MGNVESRQSKEPNDQSLKPEENKNESEIKEDENTNKKKSEESKIDEPDSKKTDEKSSSHEDELLKELQGESEEVEKNDAVMKIKDPRKQRQTSPRKRKKGKKFKIGRKKDEFDVLDKREDKTSIKIIKDNSKEWKDIRCS